mmetsp:Transcript_17158/g.28748  ORF Transcript_17158/g.28748 Transcript_17158/m.28748 type:complete len:373 (-) Transcript_17158:492-1610(-)
MGRRCIVCRCLGFVRAGRGTKPHQFVHSCASPFLNRQQRLFRAIGLPGVQRGRGELHVSVFSRIVKEREMLRVVATEASRTALAPIDDVLMVLQSHLAPDGSRGVQIRERFCRLACRQQHLSHLRVAHARRLVDVELRRKLNAARCGSVSFLRLAEFDEQRNELDATSSFHLHRMQCLARTSLFLLRPSYCQTHHLLEHCLSVFKPFQVMQKDHRGVVPGLQPQGIVGRFVSLVDGTLVGGHRSCSTIDLKGRVGELEEDAGLLRVFLRVMLPCHLKSLVEALLRLDEVFLHVQQLAELKEGTGEGGGVSRLFDDEIDHALKASASVMQCGHLGLLKDPFERDVRIDLRRYVLCLLGKVQRTIIACKRLLIL